VTHVDRPTADRRFLTVADVGDVLSMRPSTVKELIRRGELRGIQVGGRGQWRVEDVELDAYIQRLYDERDRAHAED
jgi:excisionase family DNA binding protein